MFKRTHLQAVNRLERLRAQQDEQSQKQCTISTPSPTCGCPGHHLTAQTRIKVTSYKP